MGWFGTSSSDGPTTVKQMQEGEVGYIWPSQLAVDGTKLYLNPHDIVDRDKQPEPCVRITAVKGGFEVECLGFDEYLWTPHLAKKGAIPVRRLTIANKSFTKWSDEFRCMDMYRMPLNAEFYVYSYRIAGIGSGGLTTCHDCPVFSRKVEASMLRVRRLGIDFYEIEVREGVWMRLDITM